jgi:hypothetical protein
MMGERTGSDEENSSSATGASSAGSAMT